MTAGDGPGDDVVFEAASTTGVGGGGGGRAISAIFSPGMPGAEIAAGGAPGGAGVAAPAPLAHAPLTKLSIAEMSKVKSVVGMPAIVREQSSQYCRDYFRAYGNHVGVARGRAVSGDASAAVGTVGSSVATGSKLGCNVSNLVSTAVGRVDMH